MLMAGYLDLGYHCLLASRDPSPTKFSIIGFSRRPKLIVHLKIKTNLLHLDKINAVQGTSSMLRQSLTM